MSRPSTLIVGAGIFGATAALELIRRGHRVTLLNHTAGTDPLASSNDFSRLVRADYGSDGFYAALMAQAIPRWQDWNERSGETLYHQDGFLVLAGGRMSAGGFEDESYATLTSQMSSKHLAPVRLNAALRERFAVWSPALLTDGYFNPRAGWVESGHVLEWLLAQARSSGVPAVATTVVGFLERRGRVAGAVAADGSHYRADLTLVAAGAWTPALLPHLDQLMWATGHPLHYFQLPEDAVAKFQPPHFTPWAYDIANTGLYGFPATSDGRLKIGCHGPGRRVNAAESRSTSQADEARARDFMAKAWPAAAGATLAGSRLCLYCDSSDGDFYIDHDPDRPGLVVASGDSGHGFKFAPFLGEIIADVCEGRANPWAGRFAWRQRAGRHKEEARWKG